MQISGLFFDCKFALKKTTKVRRIYKAIHEMHNAIGPLKINRPNFSIALLIAQYPENVQESPNTEIQMPCLKKSALTYLVFSAQPSTWRLPHKGSFTHRFDSLG